LKMGGVSPYGMIAVVLGMMTCLVIGFSMRERMA
jgi:hypothetical protein